MKPIPDKFFLKTQWGDPLEISALSAESPSVNSRQFDLHFTENLLFDEEYRANFLQIFRNLIAEGKEIEKEASFDESLTELEQENTEAVAPPFFIWNEAPRSMSLVSEEGKKNEEVQNLGGIAPASTQIAHSSSSSISAPVAVSPIQLPLEIQALYDKMVESMSVMTTGHVQETVLFLEAPPSSPLHGAQIVIQEFSTAPKAFNIHFVASPQGMAFVSSHTQSLLASFQNGAYSFKVNRFEVSLNNRNGERPLAAHKEPISRDDPGKDNQGKKQR